MWYSNYKKNTLLLKGGKTGKCTSIYCIITLPCKIQAWKVKLSLIYSFSTTQLMAKLHSATKYGKLASHVDMDDFPILQFHKFF